MHPRVGSICLAAGFAVLSVALAGASCDKKSAAGPNNAGGGPVVVDDPVGQAPGKDGQLAAPEPGHPYPDPVLDEEGDAHFKALAEKLASPCGKAQSLAASIAGDPSCRRAPFAQRFIKKWVKEEVPDDQIEELYQARWGQQETKEIDLTDTPFEGVPNAPVTIVEFFDYGCPHCKHTLPELEDLAAEYPSDVVIYFKHFPLSLKTQSVQAAQAAVAAARQGKFRQMHKKLFENQGAQSREDIERMAREIGLDMDRFEKDWNDSATRDKVMADRAQGDSLGVNGTPSIYVNGRTYSDTLTVEDFRDWVNEELAQGR